MIAFSLVSRLQSVRHDSQLKTRTALAEIGDEGLSDEDINDLMVLLLRTQG